MSAPTPTTTNIISIPTSPNGMAETSWFSLVSRRKLQSQAANGDRVRDNRSLRRFVLLKNSITSATTTFDVAPPSSSPLYPEPESQPDDDDEEEEDEEEDVFVFPDVCSFSPVPDPSSPPQAGDEEARWLDSLLEDLEDDEPDPDVDVATVDVDDEDDYDSYLDESDLSSLFDGFSSTSGSLSMSSESATSVSPAAHPSCAIPPSSSSTTTTTTLPLLSPQFYPLPDGPDDFDLDSELPELLGRSTEEDEDSDADSSDWPFTPSFGRSTSSLSLSLTAQQREREAAGATVDDFVEEHSYFHPLDFDYIHPNHLVSPPVAAARYRSGVSC